MAKTATFVVMGTILSLSTICFGAPASAVPPSDSGVIVIVFKDGHRQSIPMADIARMDFSATPGGAPSTAINPASSALPSKNRFVGKWKVGDGHGDNFIIKLRENGEALKSIGSGHGSWTYVNGEAHISWDDGWHDAIRRAGTKYEKFAYEPGKSFSDQPANVTQATSATPEPI